MKTEELTALGLNTEQAASVLAINGKDIEKLKSTNDTQKTELETVKTQLAEAGKTIEGFKAMDIEAVRAEADKWKAKATQAEQDAATKIAELQLNNLLDGSITAAKGKNSKAIRALLDMDAIGKSKNQSEDITKAIEALKAESGYLFETGDTPPPYAAGTGSAFVGGQLTKDTFNKMGYKDRVEMKNTNPGLYDSMKE